MRTYGHDFGNWGAPPTLPWSPPIGSTHGENEEDKDEDTEGDDDEDDEDDDEEAEEKPPRTGGTGTGKPGNKPFFKPWVFGTKPRIIDHDGPALGPGLGKGTSGGQPPTGVGVGGTFSFSKAGPSGESGGGRGRLVAKGGRFSRRKASYGGPMGEAPMWIVGNVVFPLGAVPMAMTGCEQVGLCLRTTVIGGAIAVFGVYPALAKLLVPDASYGKRLLVTGAMALAVGHVIVRRRRAERIKTMPQMPPGFVSNHGSR